MAAALLFGVDGEWNGALLASAQSRPDSWLRDAEQQLSRLPESYWSRRLTLGGKLSPESVGLIGESRIAALLINVVVPFLAASGGGAALARSARVELPAEADNRILRQTAENLFGPDHSASLYRTGLRRQGLIQIFHDFCLNDRSRCASCEFQERLKAFGAAFAAEGPEAGRR